MTRIQLAAAGAALLSFCTVHAQEQSPPTLDVRIEPRPLPHALNEWAQQTGFQLILPDEFAHRTKTTPRISGRYTPQASLDRLLVGTGLSYDMLNPRTVAIRLAKAQDRVPADASAQESSSSSDDVGTQQQQSSRASTPSAAGSETEVGRLEEIVVTAQKREERLIDVPLSITAITSDDIKRRGLVSGQDYLRGIPGVSHVGETFGESIVIRGIETTPSGQNFSSGTTVATYFGETPTTNSAGLTGGTNVDLKLVDIERVEVLRGPQGTAFGNSSLGGAVRTIPAAPKLDRLEGSAAANYSATSGNGGDNYMMQGVANLPVVVDKLAVRLVAYQFEDSGFYRNRAGSDPVVRPALSALGAGGFAVNKDEVGSASFIGGRATALFQATEALRFSVSYLTQTTEVDGQALAGTGTYEQALPQVAPGHVVRGQTAGVSDTDIDLANVLMQYDLGWGEVLATVSYIQSGSKYALPLATERPMSELARSEHDERSGEVRLSTNLQGPFDFLFGLYAESLDDEATFDDLWYGSPGTNPFDAGLGLGNYRDVRTLEQRAAFAEGSWEFVPRFTLTVGARAYDYERSTHVVTSRAFYGPDDTTTSGDASGQSYRANLSFKPDDNSLLYAGWSQGFRLGKPQPGLPPALCDDDGNGIVDGTTTPIAATRFVNSDEVDNYEVGGKVSLYDRRVTLAGDLFRIDWNGVPSRVTPTCGLGYIANAGAARSQGVELEANLRLTEAFRIDFAGSYIDADLTRDAPALGASEGDRLPGAPRVNASLGLSYAFDVVGRRASVRTDSIYVGEFYGNLAQTPQTRAGGYVKVDASARVELRNFNVELFVRNLTNVNEYTFRGIGTFGPGSLFGYRLRPRTIGVQVGYTF